MAEKKTKEAVKAAGKPKTLQPTGKTASKNSGFSIFRWMLILLVLVILSAAGFAAGVYFKFIDLNKIAETYHLSDYPVIGQYFSKPKTNFELVETEAPLADVPMIQQLTPTPQPSESLPVNQVRQVSPLNDPDKEKIEKAKQQEEAKRISKLARLYSNMKAEDAVAILNQLDDDSLLAIFGKMEEEAVSKILALMDNKRAARLTQTMLKGKQQ